MNPTRTFPSGASDPVPATGGGGLAAASTRQPGTARRALPVVHLLGIMLAGTTGCYSYSVVPVTGAPPGVTVRAHISAAEADRLAPLLGRGDRRLEGRVLESGAESLILAIPSTTAPTGVSSGPLHQRITLSRSEIFEMEVRRLNRRRTGAVTVGLSLLAAYVAIQQFGHNNERPGGSDKGGIER